MLKGLVEAVNMPRVNSPKFVGVKIGFLPEEIKVSLCEKH